MSIDFERSREIAIPGYVERSRTVLPLPAPPTSVAVIESLATGAPPTTVPQRALAEQVCGLYEDPVQRERIGRIFAKTGIITRQLAVDPLADGAAEFRRRRGTVRERMELFREHGVPLAVDVAGRALAGLDPADIGLVVFATSTGLIAPGIDIEVVRRLGLPITTARVVINFMGCAAAMNAIRTASDFARANPARKALVICMELSSVNAVFSDDVNDIVISSLFGDGCGAVVVGAKPAGHQLRRGQLVIRDSFSQLLDDSADGIVLGVNDNGITCELAEELPNYIYAGVKPAIDAALNRNGLRRKDIDMWAIHPGGPKVIGESLHSLQLAPAVAEASWAVLAEYGNMLSVALLFVLQRLLADDTAGAPIETGVAFSFAPGVVLEGLIFDVVRR